ncbi:MAG: bifunctional adenosylcobinamide kinase/adenosylcobinamide-phosphate guanylyltransferase [Proteobacteria bacterium]|nr:bifunctional adenosylcobinamide kinase/adenosylcobinamide-phosphate guanylyltransferase [Pseudomonadota bacterium]
MAEIHLITGGSRSGKSAYAQKLAESLTGPRAYVATCPVIDQETAERIRKHREARRATAWETIEEGVDLAGAVQRAGACRVLLVDCLTLWANNLLYAAQKKGEIFTEEAMAERCRELIDACGAFPGTVVFVTNELGMGIVPDNEQARLFRDCAGRCNQMMAAAAETVTLIVSGLPLLLKAGK